MDLLDVEQLNVRFTTADGVIHAVDGMNFSLDRGQTLGIVGESGSGKSQTMLALMGLLDRNGVTSGRARFQGTDLLSLPRGELNRIRGRDIGMIFQDPMTTLNPYLTLGRQMFEVLETHGANLPEVKGRRARRQRAVELLRRVRIRDAESTLDRYPHELSGGMRQRVMIAMALLCGPSLLIADEPTTALDVTVQAQILALLAELQRELGMAIILISHDLGVIAQLCREVLVMYGGRVMEHASTAELFAAPRHPYSSGLLQAIPRLNQDEDVLATIPGNPPSLLGEKPYCPFAPRCPEVFDRCLEAPPPLAADPDGRRRACFLPVDVDTESEAAPTGQA